MLVVVTLSLNLAFQPLVPLCTFVEKILKGRLIQIIDSGTRCVQKVREKITNYTN